MMRFSQQERFEPIELDGTATNLEVFEHLQTVIEEIEDHESTEDHLQGTVLLVGSSDFRSCAVRRAQAVLRFDKRPSYWSHAAVVLRWHGKKAGPKRSEGFHVPLVPAEASAQSPAHNGVTRFMLGDFADPERNPNVGVFNVCLSEEARSKMKATAKQPNRERLRYPLWDHLGRWSAYACSPDSQPNPLLEGIPLPSAAWVEYLFESAGLNIVPGAEGNHACPELLWSTLRYWSDGLREEAAGSKEPPAIHAVTAIRDPHCVAGEPPRLRLRGR